MATLNTTNIKHGSSSSNNIVLASDGTVTFPQNTGNILQVAATNVISETTSVSVQDGSIVDTPATVTVTSKAANSKFLISASISGEASQPDHNIGFVLRRVIGGSTSSINVGYASDMGNRLGVTFMQNQGYFNEDNSTTSSTSVMVPYLDSPSQSASTAITYKIGVIGLGTTATYYFGRTVSDTNNDTNERTPNYITVMEVAA